MNNSIKKKNSVTSENMQQKSDGELIVLGVNVTAEESKNTVSNGGDESWAVEEKLIAEDYVNYKTRN